jgi:hypothetical protein
MMCHISGSQRCYKYIWPYCYQFLRDRKMSCSDLLKIFCWITSDGDQIARDFFGTPHLVWKRLILLMNLLRIPNCLSLDFFCITFEAKWSLFRIFFFLSWLVVLLSYYKVAYSVSGHFHGFCSLSHP